MKVVSDSTCIISLAKIKRLKILKELFGEILIPKAVYNEIYHPEKEGFEEIRKADFIRVVEISDKRLAEFLKEYIDDGEAESIVLAMENNADLIILDDKDSRKIAKRFKLKVIGTLGVLLLAKKKGYIKDVKSLIDELKKKGFYVSKGVESRILRNLT